MKFIRLLRRIVSLVLLVSWTVSFITGLTLLLNSTRTLYWLIPLNTRQVAILHTYVSFIMSGATIIHVYLNWNTLMNYIKPSKKTS